MLNFLSLLIKEIIEILYTLTGWGFFIKKKRYKKQKAIHNMMSMLPCSFNNMVLRICYLFVCEFLNVVYNINNKYNSSALWKSAISVTFVNHVSV